jgi:hypothetical protein
LPELKNHLVIRLPSRKRIALSFAIFMEEKTCRILALNQIYEESFFNGNTGRFDGRCCPNKKESAATTTPTTRC